MQSQQADSATSPSPEEADHLLVIKTDRDVDIVISNIIQIEQNMKGDSHGKNSV